MINQWIENYKKKSLKERFLLFIGVLFLMIYLTFGLVLIFWKEFPIKLTPNYRITLGVLFIIYGIVRFGRFLKSEK
jgi:uncharacterized membrane protein (DUF485 family)